MTVSKRTRFEVLRRDNHTCRYCGGHAPDVVLTVDHVLPVALGGSDDPTNLVTACKDCNAGNAPCIGPGCGGGVERDVVDVARITAVSRTAYDPFSYFCGICWKRVRALQVEAQAIIDGGEL